MFHLTTAGNAREPEINDTLRAGVPAQVDGNRDGTPPPDPFDPDSLRLAPDAAAQLGVQKVLYSLPVRKPDKSWFVRVHPDPSYHLQTAVIELKEERETYLVAPVLWQELSGESTFSPRALYTALNRQSVLFIWPIRIPGPDDNIDAWSRSALAAADMAARGWIRVAANMSLGAYEVIAATGDLPEPTWPDLPFRDLLHIAFRQRVITTLDHPVLRRLRGEV